MRGAGQQRWPFLRLPFPYVILGFFGCLEYLDATFLGLQLALEVEANASYPGMQT